MKLLILTANLPSPTGGANARNYHLLKALARKHSVSLLAFASTTGQEIATGMACLESLTHELQVIPLNVNRMKRIQQFANVVRGQSYLLDLHTLPDLQDALDAMLARERYDAVLFESSLMAGYHVPANVMTIIDQHNIEHELLQRIYRSEKSPLRKWYNWCESRVLKRMELEYCRKTDIVLVVSERERLLLKEWLPDQRIEVVPNGVDTEIFHRDASSQELPEQIIFTGTMDYYPNTQAVLFFAKYCWPLIREQLPAATWLIVGKNPPREVQRLATMFPSVTVTGTVPDVRPYLVTSTVAIAPIQAGGGTRLKILEALAAQTAMVSTTIGCEGLAVVPNKHLLVADTPDAFVSAVVTLLRNPRLRNTLASAGRALIETQYSWEWCGEQLVRILEEKEGVLL
ncbi:MAG TPA: glycosyltransferase [Ktedonobacteraceae bacterium]|nr:glycosyltransferase [Ktedonobacteraceae bacterium]